MQSADSLVFRMDVRGEMIFSTGCDLLGSNREHSHVGPPSPDPRMGHIRDFRVQSIRILLQ